MKIESVRIRNFRLFNDETIPFNDYTTFIGPNGCGKPTVFCALNIFQHAEGSSIPVTHLYEEDFRHKNTREPIVITVTFTNLSAEAQSDFAAYVRHGKLSVYLTRLPERPLLSSAVKDLSFQSLATFLVLKGMVPRLMSYRRDT